MENEDDHDVAAPVTTTNHRRVLVLVVAIIVVAAGVAVVRLGRSTHTCTQAGCDDAVNIDLNSLPEEVRTAAKTVTICANDHCENWDSTGSSSGIRAARVMITDHTVRSASIRLADAQGNEVVKLELTTPQEATEFQPNGPDCEPTCWQLNLIAKDGALERSG